MADYSTTEVDEYEKLNHQVTIDSDDFDGWEQLVRVVESAEGGLSRNSSQQAIQQMRGVYDRFLRKFPLLFGYWKKYADLEFAIAGTESAEMVYEKGVASISNSVDLWTNYCNFKVETSHEPEIIRDLFDRATAAVGQDFLSHPLWDAYLTYEARLASDLPPSTVPPSLSILERIIHIPMHQYARYFEAYTKLAATRPLTDIFPEDQLESFRKEIGVEAISRSSDGGERELRVRVHQFHLEIYQKTQTETTKRWTFESEIKRPYFHVREIDEGQLVNWRGYLDFEEIEGNVERIKFLYERCLVTCAIYDEFWLRYVRWLEGVGALDEEIRGALLRACASFVPIGRPKIRLLYAIFEESRGRIDVARGILHSILINIPESIETYVHLANFERRQQGLNAGLAVYKSAIERSGSNMSIQGALAAELANMVWKVKADVTEARELFKEYANYYTTSKYFWINYFNFELSQPSDPQDKGEKYQRLSDLYHQCLRHASLPQDTLKDLSQRFQVYLLEHTNHVAEVLRLDKEINGPFSVQSEAKKKLAEDGNEATVNQRLQYMNGHPGVLVDNEALKAQNLQAVYEKYYAEQGEQPPQVGGQAQAAGVNGTSGQQYQQGF